MVKPLKCYKESLATIQELYPQGYTDAQIADMLGIDRTTVGTRRRALGLKARASNQYSKPQSIVEPVDPREPAKWPRTSNLKSYEVAEIYAGRRYG